MPRAQPVDSVRLVVTGREPLREIPYGQPFAYVSPYQHWTRMIARDSFVEDARLRQSLRDRIDIPLHALNWRERSVDSATFRVSLLQADREQTMWTERLATSTTTLRSCWSRNTVLQIYRGIAIERVSDGAIFWRVYAGGLLDQAAIENRLADDLAKFLLGVAPSFPVEQPAPSPPARAQMCAWQDPARLSTPTTERERPRSMPPENTKPAPTPPTPPPVRRPLLTQTTNHPEH